MIEDKIPRFFTNSQEKIKSRLADGKQFIENSWSGLKSGMISGADTVKTKFTELGDKWDTFRQSWSSGADSIREKLSEFRDSWQSGWNGIRDSASEKWDDISTKIKAPFEKIGDWFHEKFSGAWQRVKDVFSTRGEVFHGIQDGISGTFKGTVNGLIDGLNSVLRVPFWNISEALRVVREWTFSLPWAPDWQPFGGLPSFDMPEIPRLAKGGLISQPTLAMVGDNPHAHADPEVVSPLSKLRSMLPEQGADGRTIERLDTLITLLEMLLAAVQDSPAGLSDKAVYAAAERGRRRFDKMKGVT